MRLGNPAAGGFRAAIGALDQRDESLDVALAGIAEGWLGHRRLRADGKAMPRGGGQVSRRLATTGAEALSRSGGSNDEDPCSTWGSCCDRRRRRRAVAAPAGRAD